MWVSFPICSAKLRKQRETYSIVTNFQHYTLNFRFCLPRRGYGPVTHGLGRGYGCAVTHRLRRCRAEATLPSTSKRDLYEADGVVRAYPKLRSACGFACVGLRLRSLCEAVMSSCP